MRSFVALDRSPGAATALRLARRLQRHGDGPVVAAQAWTYGPTSVVPGGPTPIGPDAQDEATIAEVRAIAEEVLGDAEGVEPLALRGPAAHAVAAEVASRRPDLVLAGRRSLRSTDPRLLGSVGRRLVDRAPCPVLLLGDSPRPADDPAPIVLVCLDGSDDALEALRWSCELARPLGATIVAVHARPVPMSGATDAMEPADDPVLAAALAELETTGLPHRLALAWGEPRRALEGAAEEHDATIVVVASRGLGAIERMLLGSTASYLVTHLDRAVAVVPPSARR